MTASTRRYGTAQLPSPATVRGRASASAAARSWPLVAIVAIVGLPTALRSVAGPDLWWHVETGRRILAERSIPTVDDWSYTATGAEWHNHEWLAQVVFAAVTDVVGGPGLVLLRAALYLAVIGLLCVVVNRRVQTVGATLAIVAATTAVATPFLNLRVHTFTYALLLWSLVMLDALAGGRRWPLWALPLSFVAWANLHGGFVLGLGLVGLTLISWLFSSEAKQTKRTIMVLGPACVVATLANPAGVGLYAYLVTELGANHSIVSEWQPAAGASLLALLVAAATVAGFCVLARRLPAPGLTMVFVGSVLVTYSQARFLVVVALVGAVAVADVWPSVRERMFSARGQRRVDLAPALYAGTAIAALVMLVGASGHVGTLQSLEDAAPSLAADFVDQHDLGPNVASELTWGGYLIARFDDDVLVAIDGRNLTVYNDEWVDQYLRAMVAGTALEVPGLEATDVWLVDADGAQARSLEESFDWKLAYSDGQAAVFVAPDVWPDAPVVGPANPPAQVPFPYED